MAQTFEVFNFQNSTTAANTGSINLGTMGVNRLVLLFVHTDGATRGTVTSVSDANGLTWTLYKTFNFDSEDPTNHKQRLEIWWAFAAAQQVANPVTVNISATVFGPTLAVGAIAGLDPSRYTGPFDADPSLPGTQSNPSSTGADATLTFSTHDAHTAMLAVYANDITNQTPSTPSGWTALISSNYLSSFNRMVLYVFGQVYSAQQVNTVVSMGTKTDWGIITLGAGGDVIFPHSQLPSAGF